MKRSEYMAKAEEFRALITRESAKPQSEQQWPAFEDWLSVPGCATCTTPNCEVFGQTFFLSLQENADGVYRVICGKCGSSIEPVLDLEEG